MTEDPLLLQPLDSMPLVFFDVETTGLPLNDGHRICEIALLRVRGAVVETAVSTLVNPERALDARAAAVHGIAPDLLASAPIFAGVANVVLDTIDGAVLVAHNAPFDISFLGRELALIQLPPPRNYVLDTLVLARRLLRRHSYSLLALSHDLGLEPPIHRAMSDVLALRGLFAHLVEQMAALRIANLGEMLRLQRGLLPGQPEPVPPSMIGQAIVEHRRMRIVYRSRSSPNPTERLIAPLELTQEHSGIYVRAFCFLRNDMRSFAIDKIEAMELE